MLSEVRAYLPAFLSPAATEQGDPVGDAQELLGLHAIDLARVLSVHVCLSDEVRALSDSLGSGLRRPLMATERPKEQTQTVRGPIDWAGTVRLRAGSGWDRTRFVVRPGRRVFDVPENRALAWVLERLRLAVDAASALVSLDSVPAETGWLSSLKHLDAVLRRATRVEWLREIPAERPSTNTRARLRAARTAFYRITLGRAVEVLLTLVDPGPDEIASAICERYFRPDKAWRLFEVLVALRLARELGQPEHGLTPRPRRLLTGTPGGTPFARFQLADYSEIRLYYQGWPRTKTPSEREGAARRHGMPVVSSIPDLFVTRVGADGSVQDAAVLELKASKRPGYLGEGLSQLLGYLGERPSIFGTQPSGWLVAPTSSAFQPAPPDGQKPLWIVAADEVAAAVRGRFLPADPYGTSIG